MIGSGTGGRVFKCQNLSDPDNIVAIKVVDKNAMAANIEALEEEQSILRKVDHPGIVKYYETYDDTKYLYLVTEFISGWSISSQVTKNGGGEYVMCGFIKQILESLVYLHS
jgi:calcium-dependent protein kinase